MRRLARYNWSGIGMFLIAIGLVVWFFAGIFAWTDHEVRDELKDMGFSAIEDNGDFYSIEFGTCKIKLYMYHPNAGGSDAEWIYKINNHTYYVVTSRSGLEEDADKAELAHCL